MKREPHPHAEIIKAWADGHIIDGRQSKDHNWIEVADGKSHMPHFYPHFEYRIRPTIIRYIPVVRDDANELQLRTPIASLNVLRNYLNTSDTLKGRLVISMDPMTGELVDVKLER